MVKRKSPIDAFFALGDKVTKGDPARKAQFDYYLMWIIFIGFVMILVSNLLSFFQTYNAKYLGWTLVIGAIIWFQYGSMKTARQVMTLMAKQKAGTTFDEIESVNDMLKTKSKNEPVKGGKKK